MIHLVAFEDELTHKESAMPFYQLDELEKKKSSVNAKIESAQDGDPAVADVEVANAYDLHGSLNTA